MSSWMWLIVSSLLLWNIERAASFTAQRPHLPPSLGFSLSKPLYQAANSPLRVQSTAAIVPDTASQEQKVPFPLILWRFARPHTVIGSAMAIPSLHLLAAPSVAAAFSLATAQSIGYAMIPSLLMNLYVTGLNQITDLEIDKINKPDLPIAAGMLSMRDAKITVVAALLTSLFLGCISPRFGTAGLNVALWGSAILGTLYSLNPFRLKRFPLAAAICIVAVRGAVINAGFFQHAQAAAYGMPSSVLPAACWWNSTFFAVFGLVIALMKDVPDVLGDRTLNIRTFSVRLGQKRVFSAMKNVLSGLFVCTSWAFLRRVSTSNPAVTVARLLTGLSALAFGWSVQARATGVDPTDSAQVYSYYMHLWKLFYLSYFVLPFAM